MAKIEDIVNLFKKENLPTAVACTVILAPLIYVVMNWHYDGVINTYKTQLDVLTKASATDQQTIKQLNESKSKLKNGIKTSETDIVWPKIKSE